MRDPQRAAGDRSGLGRGCTLIALVLSSVMASHAAESPDLVPIESFELANGMRFVLVERPQAVTVAAGWVVGAGSVDDPPEHSGTAHMLEHMLFKGTGSIRSGELDLLYADAGATGLNALTQRDLTAYFVGLPAEKLELWFWLESDRLLDPALREVEAEREVVREERRLRVDSSPTGPIEEALEAKLWEAHAYGRPVAGEPGDLDRIGTSEARAFFDVHYRAANLTAVLVGAFDATAVRELAQRYFGRLAGTPRAATEREAPAALLLADLLVETCECRPQVRLLYRGVPFTHPDAAALDVLVSVLNGRSGRLHRALVLEQDLAFAAFARHEGLRAGGVLSLIAEAKGEADAAALMTALELEIVRLLTQPAREAEVERAKTRLRADAIRSVEEPSELMLQMLIHSGLGDAVHLNSWPERVEAVTAADVERVARNYLLGKPRVVGLFDRAAGPEAAP